MDQCYQNSIMKGEDFQSQIHMFGIFNLLRDVYLGNTAFVLFVFYIIHPHLNGTGDSNPSSRED